MCAKISRQTSILMWVFIVVNENSKKKKTETEIHNAKLDIPEIMH